MERLRFSITYPKYYRDGAEGSNEMMTEFANGILNPLKSANFVFEGRSDEAVLPMVILQADVGWDPILWRNVTVWRWLVIDDDHDPEANVTLDDAEVYAFYAGDGLYQYEALVTERVLSVLTTCDTLKYHQDTPAMEFSTIVPDEGMLYLRRPEGDFDSAFWVEAVAPDALLADSGASEIDPLDDYYRIVPLSWGLQAFWTNKKLCVEA